MPTNPNPQARESGPAGVARPDAAPLRPRGRIVYTFLLVTLAVGLLPLAMVAQKLVTISREALVTSQQEVQLQMAGAIARQVDASLAAVRGGLARLAEGIAALPRSGQGAPAVWRSLLERSLGD